MPATSQEACELRTPGDDRVVLTPAAPRWRREALLALRRGRGSGPGGLSQLGRDAGVTAEVRDDTVKADRIPAAGHVSS